MASNRFFIRPDQIFGFTFKIKDPSVVNHMKQVLRLEPGNLIELFDGIGTVYTAKIGELRRDEVTGEILDAEEVEPEGKPVLTLAQALPKGSKIDEVVKMGTEVGVVNFLLYESEYSIVKTETFNDKKLERLNKIAQESSRQSERAVVPQIAGPVNFNEMIKINAPVKVLFHSRPVAGMETIDEVRSMLKPQQEVLAAVGPEGGFAPEEIRLAKANDFKIVNLSLPVMRTETAGVVIAGILLY